jgi:hypothetical protein
MIAIVLGIVRVLIVLMIVRVIVSFFMQFRRPPGRPPQRSGRPAEVAGGTLVRDPHCGTFIPESKAVVSGGLFFCSATCRDAWASAHGRPSSLKA